MNTAALCEWLILIRREFHKCPELSGKEFMTTQKIVGVLEELGVETRTLPDLTGTVGLIRGVNAERTIALRADIDALPIDEMNDVPYRSLNTGVMHACGHDAHIAIMLGVAKAMIESRMPRELHGNVKFLFQPSEEEHSGARKMIEHEVLEYPHIDRIISGHVYPNIPTGVIGICPSVAHAAAVEFTLVIKGKAAHGARPQESIDPIVAGSYFVTAVQSIISRNIEPTQGAVITVGKFTAGNAANVIPENAEMEGTIRALTNEVMEQLVERVKIVAKGLEETFDVRCQLTFHRTTPSCVNDETVASFLRKTAEDVVGHDNVRLLGPSMGTDDFAFFAMERPAATIRLGCGNPRKGNIHPLHSPQFDIDEDVLIIAVNIFLEAVRRYLY